MVLTPQTLAGSLPPSGRRFGGLAGGHFDGMAMIAGGIVVGCWVFCAALAVVSKSVARRHALTPGQIAKLKLLGFSVENPALRTPLTAFAPFCLTCLLA